MFDCFAGPAAGWEEKDCVWWPCAGIAILLGLLPFSDPSSVGWSVWKEEWGNSTDQLLLLALPSCFKCDWSCSGTFNRINLNSAVLWLPKVSQNEPYFLVLDWLGIVCDINEMLLPHAPTVPLNKSPARPSMWKSRRQVLSAMITSSHICGGFLELWHLQQQGSGI